MRRLFITWMAILVLASCAAGQTPTQDAPVATEEPLRPTPTAAPVTEVMDVAEASTATPAPIATPERKDPLPAEAWMQMPAVPSNISDRARAIYE